MVPTWTRKPVNVEEHYSFREKSGNFVEHTEKVTKFSQNIGKVF